jgi:hypothetical protein
VAPRGVRRRSVALIDGGRPDYLGDDADELVEYINVAAEHVAAAVTDAVALIDVSDKVVQDLFVGCANKHRGIKTAVRWACAFDDADDGRSAGDAGARIYFCDVVSDRGIARDHGSGARIHRRVRCWISAIRCRGARDGGSECLRVIEKKNSA